MKKIESKTYNLSVTYIISLIAIATVALFMHGIRVAVLLLVMSVAAFVTDFICVRIKGRNFEISDLSCIAEAWLLAFMFPSLIPLGKAVTSVVVAVIIGRHILGENKVKLLPSPVIGYTFALCAWKDDVLSFKNITGAVDTIELSDGLVMSSSASFNSSGVFRESDFDILTGNVNGAIGTNVIALLLLCAVILVIARRIRITPFIGVIVSLAFFGGIVQKSGDFILSAKYEVLANMAVFAAIFFVSDKDIAPVKPMSGLLYGLTLGMVSYYLTFFTDQENAIIPAIIICSPICILCRSLAVSKKASDNSETTTAETGEAEIL